MNVSNVFYVWLGQLFLVMKDECKVSCVNLIAWIIVAKEDKNILISSVFEYGTESKAECSARKTTKNPKTLSEVKKLIKLL